LPGDPVVQPGQTLSNGALFVNADWKKLSVDPLPEFSDPKRIDIEPFTTYAVFG
jgi:hypothetical protein